MSETEYPPANPNRALAIETIPLDLNGHRGRDQIEVSEIMGIRSRFDGPSQCSMCGQWLKISIGADSASVTNPCALPDGITTTVPLAVPSGRIIVTDDLRPIYRLDDEVADGFLTYCSAAGQAQYIEAMAGIGCAYGPVGNTCPGLYRTTDGYVIANSGYDEATDQEIRPPEWERLAAICTDLWAYSIADYDDWVARGGLPKSLGRTDTVVTVPAGVYRFTYHGGERAFADGGAAPTIYAHIAITDPATS